MLQNNTTTHSLVSLILLYCHTVTQSRSDLVRRKDQVRFRKRTLCAVARARPQTYIYASKIHPSSRTFVTSPQFPRQSPCVVV